MRRLRDIPIGRKLTLVIMLASCVALAVSMVAVIMYDLVTFQRHALLDVQAQAEMVRINAQAALVFDDPSVAQEIIDALSAKAEIISACLYKKDGKVFASYVRPDSKETNCPPPESDGPRFGKRHLGFFRTIADRGEVLGNLYLCYDVRPAYTRLPQYSVMVGMVVLALVAVYLFLSTALRRLISVPILNLANTAQIVTAEKNYGIRAPKQADDEIGHLTDAFNHMLATIAARDEAVQHANEELKKRGQDLQRELAERQRTQAALHESEEQWRSLAENAPDIIMTLNHEGQILFVNRALPGFELTKVIGSNLAAYMPVESRKKLLECLERVFATGQNASAEVGAGPDSKLVWYSTRMGPIKSEGRVVAATLIASDITERKLAEIALRESEERYRRFFEEDLTGDYTAAPSGQLLTCNPAFASIFAFSSVKEALQGNLMALHASAEVYHAFLDRLRKEKKLTYHEIQLRRLDGKPVFVIQNVLGTFNQTGDLVEFKGYVFDITQHKHLEEQFRQAFKMEAVGRLAGGIAHDFNNLLTAILGFSSILLEDLAPDSPHRDGLVQISKAAQQAAALTRQLLAYSRKQVLQPKVIDLNQVVSEVHKILRRLIGEDIELVTILDPDLGKVKADPSQMEQVIINLATNARDAMPQGGKLTLRTCMVQSDPNLSHRPGNNVLLSISDTGSGMSAEVKNHLFEPFFTTKDVGKGTGLGLSTVYGIIKQSDGDIEVDSEPGRGTTFRVYLPSVTEMPERPKVSDSAFARTGGLETILLVEDEAGVRNLLRLVLEQKGYTVLEAQNGTDALQLAAKHRGTIHLLLTDLVMPQMSGRELAERIVQMRPNVRLLYMSGYTDDAVIRHGILELDAAFLQKPFMPAVLLERVRQLLDSGSKS